MLSKKMVILLAYGFVFSFLQVSHAFEEKGCPVNWQPVISFEEFQISDIEQDPPEEITVKGKLKLPVACQSRKKRFIPKKNLPAVVILHGSGAGLILGAISMPEHLTLLVSPPLRSICGKRER
ncbi:hypothetical protein [Desulfobacter sp.]|uniref:hypothetical protein n=1 Tax=Desulfobacter sp. TaxID=2294 RepID=UPI003D0DE5AB